MKIETKELEPSLWKDLEKLFGDNGACGGCWCMSWRVQKGEDWNAMKGAGAKARMRHLVLSRSAHGIIAYHDGTPVGWCSFGKRQDYFKLDRAPSLKCSDGAKVWSIPCFFVKKEFRRMGVGTQLLEHALKALKKKGALIAEAYPSKPYNYGKNMPAAFAWTGTQPMFKKAGFKIAGNRDGGKQRVRKEF